GSDRPGPAASPWRPTTLPPAWTLHLTPAENSEVSPVARLVAVAVTIGLPATGAYRNPNAGALPSAPVTTTSQPRNTSPPPPAPLAKNSTRKAEGGGPAKGPVTVRVPAGVAGGGGRARELC